MATAFYGTIVIRNSDGTVQADRFDSTDVSGAFATFTSVGGEKTLTVLKGGHIVDIVTNITSAGTTLDFKLWLNQRDTNIRWVQSANFPTVDSRFPNLTPIPVSAGTKLQIEAIT
jgi:hypothetical protein